MEQEVLSPVGDPETRARERFVDLVQGLDAIVWEMDVATWTFTFVNQRVEEILGYPAELWLKEPGFWAERILHPDDREWALNFCMSATRESRDHEFEYRAVAADGRIVFLRDIVRVIRDEDGSARLLRGVMVDITEQKETERELRERERHVALVAEVGAAVAELTALPEILQRCAEAVVEQLDAAFARIWTLNEAEQMLELRASAGMYTHRDGPHGQVPVGEFKIGRIAAAKQPHLTNDVLHDPRVSDKEWAHREGMVAFAGYPLLLEGRVLGVVAMFARRPLEERALEALGTVAERLALVVERKRTETELRDRERQLAEAQRIAHLGSWQWRIGADAVEWSEALYEIFGLPTGAPVDFECYLERIHPEDRERVTGIVQRALESGRGYAMEHRVRRPDGTVRYVFSEGQVEVDDQGEPVRLFGIAQDVTERREAAQRAQQLALEQVARQEAEAARRQVQRILESITDAFFALDHGWHFTYLNNEAEQLLQRAREELLGNSIWEAFPEAVGSTFYTMYHRAVDRQQTVQFQEFFPPLDRWFEVRAFPAETGLSVYFRDVTEQRRAQEALRQSEQRYRSLIEATAAIVWRTPASGELEGEQPGWSAFTGQTPEQYRGWGWIHAVHPDERARTAQIWQNALENRAMYEAEHRLRRHDGEYRHMLARGVPILDEHGQIREWVGIHSDITERKLLEERQRFLVEAGTLFASSLDYETTLTSVARLAVPTLADWCAVDLLANGSVHRVEVAHTDPAKRELALELERRYPADPDADFGVPRVLRSGQPELVPEIPEEVLRTSARDEEHLRILQELGLKSYLVVPMMARGRTLGAITLVSAESGRRYSAADLETAQELALRAAFAIDNARLVAEINLERARLSNIFIEAPAFIATLRGPEHVFEMANPLYYQLIGEREIIGKPVREALPEIADQGFFELLDEVYRTGQPFVGNEVRVMVRKQPDAPLEESFVNFVYQPVVGADGAVTGIFVHGVEVTAQVRARQEVEQKAAELARLAAALERSNQELDQFAYVTSHDLKAPLRGISNLAQWIEEDLPGEVPADVKEHLELLKGRAQRMEGLIEGILQYSRAGRVRGEIEEVNTRSLVREVVDLLDPPENLSIEIADELPILRTERLPLQQVFLNLIGNAVKYVGRTDGRVRIESRKVNGVYEFSVSDNGPGIAPEYHERIFGIFQTLEARDKVEGTGIGLSLVKKIVEHRGGRVRVESAPGAGATFRFSWPA
jgi:PAS domain S-box-containing protein